MSRDRQRESTGHGGAEGPGGGEPRPPARSGPERVGTCLAPGPGMDTRTLNAARLALLLVLTLGLQGCEVVGAIFRAGFWTAIALVLLIVVMGAWIARTAGRRRPPGS